MKRVNCQYEAPLLLLFEVKVERGFDASLGATVPDYNEGEDGPENEL